jgi:hypothetical protein
MTIYAINNQTDFTNACNAHAAGDTFRFANGVDVTVPDPWDGTFTLRKNCRWEVVGGRGTLDANPLGAPGGSDGTFSACFNRQAIVRGFFKLENNGGVTTDTIYIGPISFRFPSDIATKWPGVGQTWADTVGISDLSFARAQPIFNDFAGELEWDGTEWDHGWGPTAAAHSMETAYTLDDANNCYYGPSATFGNCGSIVGDDLRFKSVNGRGFVGKMDAGATLTIGSVWSEKTVTDFNQWTTDAPNKDAKITFNTVVMFDCIGGNINARLDYDAIHGDGFQLGAQNANGYCAQIRINNVLVVNSLDPDLAIAGPIGQIQCIFLIAPALPNSYNCFYNNVVVRNGLLINVNKGVQIDGNAGAYVRNVVAINPTFMGSEFQTYAASCQMRQARGLATNARYANSYVANSIFEGITSTSGLVQENCTSLAVQDPAQATIFAGGATPATLWDWYAHYRTTGSYSTQGPQHATLRAFLDDPLDFTGEPVFFKPASLTSQPRNTSVTTACAAIYGGDDGDLLDVVLPSGLTMQVLENDETTVLQTITSAGNGTATNRVAVGKQGRFTVTTGAGYDDLDSYDYTIGGRSFTWSVRTLSSIDFPGGTYATNTQFCSSSLTRLQKAGAVLSDSTHGMMWVDFVLNSAPSAFQSWLTGTSSRLFRCQVTPNGGGFNLYMSLSDSTSGTQLAGVQYNALTYGKRYRIGFSADLSLATAAERLFYGGYNVTDNVALGAPAATFSTAAGAIGWSYTSGAGLPRFGGPPMTLYALFVDSVSLQQLGISAPSNNWNYAPVDVGPAGELLKENPAHSWTGDFDASAEYQISDGVRSAQGNYFVSLIDNNIGNTPPATATSNSNWRYVDRLPLLWIVGETTPSNRGNGNSWAASGSGGIAAVNADAWPPVLALETVVRTAGPYTAGQPIDILVRPVVGYPKDVNITASSDASGTFVDSSRQLPRGSNGVVFTYTPSAAGEHTITFVEDGGYSEPAPLALTVAGSGGGGASPVRSTGLGLSGMRLGL